MMKSLILPFSLAATSEGGLSVAGVVSSSDEELLRSAHVHAKLADEFNSLLTNATVEGFVPKEEISALTLPGDALLDQEQLLLLHGGSYRVAPELKQNMPKLTAVVTTLQSNIEKAHSAAQKQISAMANDAVKDCSITNEGAKFQTAYMTGKNNHFKCRTDTTDEAATDKQCEMDLAILKEAKKTACAAAPLLEPPVEELCAASSGEPNLLHYYKRNAALFKKKFETWKKADTKCQEATTAVDNKKCGDVPKVADTPKDCNTLLDELEAAACQWAGEIVKACTTYEDCFAARKKKYEEDQAAQKEQEESRINQWRMTSRFKCLFSSATTGAVDKAALDKCADYGKYDVTALKLVFPKFPEMGKCAAPTIYPGTELYKTEVYGALPADMKVRDPIACVGLPAAK